MEGAREPGSTQGRGTACCAASAVLTLEAELCAEVVQAKGISKEICLFCYLERL